MTGLRCLLRLLVLCALAGAASAQVEVKLQMPRKSFVAGESIPVTVSITNQSGQDINFQGSRNAGWIDFTVTSTGRGVPMTPAGEPAFGSMSVPLGQTKARGFDLRKIFPLTQTGNYSVYATIRLPGQTREGFISNRVAFNLDAAVPYWTQRAGVSGTQGQSREFRVLNYNNGKKSLLYAQVIDLGTGSPLQTHSLGEYLSFSKPTVTLDNRQVMHVLYLVAPTVWSHAKVTSEGMLLGAELHKTTGAGNPMLTTSRTGEVGVANSIPYDPRAEAEARSKFRKASDRPAALFQ
jgi:hypothetical protein